MINIPPNKKSIDAISLVISILDQYNAYCPEGFETEVHIKTQFMPVSKTLRNVGYSGITCQKMDDDFNTCRDGYEKSYYDQFSRNPGFLGCIKYAICEETKPGYIDWGKTKCLECDAGGCVDYERWVELGGAICKVNFEDPSKTPPCKPYQE